MGSGGSNTVTTQPWTPAREPLETLIQDVSRTPMDVFTPPTYDGPMVGNLSGNTQSAIDMLTNAVNQPWARDIAQRMGGNAMDFMRRVGNMSATGGGQGPASGFYGNQMRTGGGLGAGADVMRRMTDTGRTYRNFDQIRDRVADEAQGRAASMFGGGLMEGGLIAQEAGRGISDAIANVEYDAYSRAEDRALNAAGGLQSAYGNMMDRRFAGAGGRQAQFEGQQGRRMAGMGMMPSAIDTLGSGYQFGTGERERDARLTGSAGAIQDQWNNAFTQGELQRFIMNQNPEMRGLQNYAQMLMGLGGMGGSQTQPGPSTGSRIAGGLSTGLGIYGALGGPAGIGLGVLGGLGSML